jgi:hypothetical protein
MKAYKFEIIAFDPNGDCDFGSMTYELVNQEYFSARIFSAQSTEIGEWDDDHPLNKYSKSKHYIENAVWEPEEIGST